MMPAAVVITESAYEALVFIMLWVAFHNKRRTEIRCR